MTSQTTLSWQRIVLYCIVLYCIVLQRMKLASKQRALSEENSFAFRNRKLDAVGDWCNRKGIQSAYFRYDSDISKCKRSIDAANVYFSQTLSWR